MTGRLGLGATTWFGKEGGWFGGGVGGQGS